MTISTAAMPSIDPASFRDPEGYVYRSSDQVFRKISSPNAPILNPDYKVFFDHLVDRNLLVPYEQLTARQSTAGGAELKLQPLPLITYPYEWSFGQLRTAALKTLEVGLMALDAGLTLKDASAYNIQIDWGEMVFIDHTSFEKTDGKMPWIAYGQFCRHFIAPLYLTSFLGINAVNWLKLHIDGIDVVDAARMMPLRAMLNVRQLMHITFHAWLSKKYEREFSLERRAAVGRRTKSGRQKDLLEHLRGVVSGVKSPTAETQWRQYYEFTNYSDNNFRHKERIVDNLFGKGRYGTVWDIGANNGHFSRIAAKHCGLVLALDIDFRSVEESWRLCRRDGVKNVVPLIFNILNPSPGIGFDNLERPSLAQRSNPDAILVLAVVHHLILTGGLRMEQLAHHFRKFNADVIIEFPDRDDSKVVQLFQSLGHERPDYSLENFEMAFSKYFRTELNSNIGDSARRLYCLRPA